MKKLFLLILSFVFLLSCSITKRLPAGSPPKIKEKELRQKVQKAENQYEDLVLRANGKYSDGESSQSFKVQIRMLKDSLVWADIADPLIGIKLARAIAFKDSVAFINRIERSYFTGDLKGLQQRISMDLSFDLLQNLLAANLVFPLTKDYELFYQAGTYVWADYDFEESLNAQFTPMGEVHQMFIDPKTYKANQQKLNEGNTNKEYTVNFKGLKNYGDWVYPEEIEIIFTNGSSVSSLKLNIKSVKKNTQPKFPFSIPEQYAPMR